MLVLHENTVVGEFSFTTEKVIWCGFPHPPIGEATLKNLLTWLASRISPYEICDLYGVPYYGVSFTDNFWICDKSDMAFFEDVNAFAFANIPTNQTSIVFQGCISHVKPFTENELYACKAAMLLGLDVVSYYRFDDYLLSPILSNQYHSWFNLHDIPIMNIVKEKYSDKIANMILFDAIVGNAGRSAKNISLVCQPSTQRVLSLAPSYSLHETFYFVETVSSIWGDNLAEEGIKALAVSKLNVKNLIRNSLGFPKTYAHVLYHNLLRLNAI